MVGPSVSNGEPAPPGRHPGGQASSGAGRFTNLWHLGRVGSTNDVALEAAARGEAEGLVVVADEQLAGRGRLGRTWVAPARSALLCSVLLRPAPLGPGSGFLAVSAVALAARRAAADLAGVDLGLKWPNDLLAGDDKVAGVLAEVGAGGAVVVGIGCNLAKVEGALPAGATSLEEAGGTRVGRDAFLDRLLAGLEARYGALVAGPEGGAALLAEARAASATLGRIVRVELPGGRHVVGEAAALLDDGRLVLDRAGAPGGTGPGERVVVEAGDVVHLRALPGQAGD